MFGCICAGRPVQTNLNTISPTQFTFLLSPPLNHIVVFLLPGTTLPLGTAATVYIQLPGKEFQLLGGIGNEKPSAIFRVRGIDDASLSAGVSIPLGISVEPVEAVQQQLATLPSGGGVVAKSGAAAGEGQIGKEQVNLLAKRIITNAYNFLTGFTRTVGGEDVVGMKHFMEWWQKFERRVQQDESFLFREAE